MRILVVGAGATGGYFGGLLARAGRDVTFLVRPARAEALRETGLTVAGADGEWTTKPDVVTPEELVADRPASAEIATMDDPDAPYDVVLLSVKAYSLEDAIDDVAPAVGPATVIVPGLNGLAHMDCLDEKFGRHRVLGGVMYVATTLDHTGRIVQLNPGLNALTWGARDDVDAERAAALVPDFTDAGFTARNSSHIELAMWEKWINLGSLGAITCLMRGTIGEIASAHGGIAYAGGVIDECIAVAAAYGFTIRPDVAARAHASLTDPTSGLTSSMYRDLSAGRRTEADHIIGDLIARARSKNVDVPLLEIAYTNLSVHQRRLAPLR
ncbi:MAG TPA: ketopantoate reductase family protein [Micromonosporaceae bacterium]|jgi:2-dehydropantoate 2-reductase